MAWAEEQDWFGLEDLIFEVDPMLFWTTKNNDKIKISDMSDTHIKNCINLILKTGLCIKYLDSFFNELIKRGGNFRVV